MYFIIETQMLGDGQGAAIVSTRETRNEADSEYYRIMQSAAVSQVPVHGAIIVDHNCNPLMYRAYDHREPEPEE